MKAATNDTARPEGVHRAYELVKQAATPRGFVASVTERHNYKRIWGRDSVIVSLAALQTGDTELIAAVKASLKTLRDAQGPQGQIPSNVDPETEHVSYGGTAGRVDASLWFIIGAHQYWRTTGDSEILSDYLDCLKKIEFILAAWEFNSKGLLYIPETGDWADEYIQHGYVLYDQLLYWRALVGLAELYQAAEVEGVERINKKAHRLKKLIQANYWFYKCEDENEYAYHPTIFKKGCEAAEEKGAYWFPFFSPFGYGYRFDSFANTLVQLFDIADDNQKKAVTKHITDKVVPRKLKVLPAFSPVVTPVDHDWPALQSSFSNEFKNKPHEYHNGGLWPMITGFYIAELARRGDTPKAEQYLEAMYQANQLGAEGDDWGFYEYINSDTLEPGGTRHQVWSASGTLMGYYALQGTQPL